MTKYYRVLKDNFLWRKGAIIATGDHSGYRPIEDVWNNTPVNNDEYISCRVVEHENNAKFFERIYKTDLKSKIFATAEEIREGYGKLFKAKK